MDKEIDKENEALKLLQNHYDREHQNNKAKIRYGIFVLIFVPIAFLILMFLVPDSSKIIFLVLWIVSLFAISAYLIAAEYADYNMWKEMKDVLDLDENECLIDDPAILLKAKELIEQKSTKD